MDATPIATTHERAARRFPTNSAPLDRPRANVAYRRRPGHARMRGGDRLPAVDRPYSDFRDDTGRLDGPENLLAILCGLAGRAG